MQLNKVKLGTLISLVTDSNINSEYDENSVRGISIDKKFIPTKADLSGVDLKKYTLVKPKQFAYVSVTSRNGEKISLAYNFSDEAYLVSSTYVVFNVISNKLLPEYLYIFFNRTSFDRYSRFNSWGSARETFSWKDMCDVEIELPDIEIQQKYVDIYMGLKNNIESYESGLDDLKLLCDAHIEKLRREIKNEKLEGCIIRTDEKNSNNAIKNVMGVSVYKQFRTPTSKVNKNELSTYKIVHPKEISFVQTTHNEKVFAYALNDSDEDIVVTSVNEVFKTDSKKLLPEYLAMFFNRTEFDRYARFNSWGSARETFTWDDLCEVKIPIPSVEKQQDIVNIYTAYKKMKNIVEELKQIRINICPILIKGSVEESKNMENECND